MTTTINAAYVQTLLNDAGLAAATAVILADHTINALNTFGAGLSNLVAGTGDYTSKQAGAIETLLYEAYRDYKNSTGANTALGPLSLSFSTKHLTDLARQLAKRLKASSIAFVVGEDDTGLT